MKTLSLENADKAKRFITTLFPTAKLVERLTALGAVNEPTPSHVPYPLRIPAGVRISLRLKIPRPNGDVYVSLWFYAVQRPGTWLVTHYSMHFGPTPRDADPPSGPNYYFRVDHTFDQGHHFHHHLHANAYTRGHIPASKSNPQIPATVDPAWFVEILEVFLKTNTVPIGVI